MRFRIVKRVKGNDGNLVGYLVECIDENSNTSLYALFNKFETWALAKVSLIDSVEAISEESISGTNGFEIRKLGYATEQEIEYVMASGIKISLDIKKHNSLISSIVMTSDRGDGFPVRMPIYSYFKSVKPSENKTGITKLNIIDVWTYPGLVIKKFGKDYYLDGNVIIGARVYNSGDASCQVHTYKIKDGHLTEKTITVFPNDSALVGLSELRSWATSENLAIYGDIIRLQLKNIRVQGNKIVMWTDQRYHSLEDEEKLGPFIQDDNGKTIDVIDPNRIPLKVNWHDAFHENTAIQNAEAFGIPVAYTEKMKAIRMGQVKNQPVRKSFSGNKKSGTDELTKIGIFGRIAKKIMK